ncbi:MAG: FMN-binding protein [Clostridiales bacterium]|jgi:major membrane immunogen (membrane-anchored lipoprotein)|nr:FMN-binding protein [Clostridiales bacterium]
MKKVLGLILTMLLVVAVVTACGSTKDNDSKDQGKTNEPVTYKDGTYQAEDPDFDDRGWKAQIQIKVEGGKIKDVVYDEVNQEGKKKSEDEDYHKNYKEQRDVELLDAYDKLQKSLVDKQNPDAVDTYTGATSTTAKFKALAKEALKDASQ